MNNHEDGAANKAAGTNSPKNSTNSAYAQRIRLLTYLREHGSIDTLTARRELDILGVAPRIFELRHRFGIAIETVWIDCPTDCGKFHRVALYVLSSEVQHG